MRTRLILPALAGLLAAMPAEAAALVPFDVQVPLVLKALTYDRALKARSGDQVRILVVVPVGQGRADVDELLSVLAALPDRTVNGMPVTFKEVQADGPATVDQALRGGRWAAAYVMPGFGESDLTQIQQACASRQVLAVAALAADVEKGMAFGVGAHNNRPQIVVNLPRAKAAGSDFDLALLRVSRVIQ